MSARDHASDWRPLMNPRRLSLFAVLLCALLAASSTHAQAPGNPILRGKITDATGAPVAGAVLEIKGTRLRATSGEDGSYRIEVRPGSYTLVVKRIGYGPEERKITVPGPETEGEGLDLTLASAPVSRIVWRWFVAPQASCSARTRLVEWRTRSPGASSRIRRSRRARISGRRRICPPTIWNSGAHSWPSAGTRGSDGACSGWGERGMTSRRPRGSWRTRASARGMGK